MATKNEEEVVMFLDIKRDGNDISSLKKKRNNNSNKNAIFPLERVLRSSSRDFSVHGKQHSSLL
jgi:hypothetical protein